MLQIWFRTLCFLNIGANGKDGKVLYFSKAATAFIVKEIFYNFRVAEKFTVTWKFKITATCSKCSKEKLSGRPDNFFIIVEIDSSPYDFIYELLNLLMASMRMVQ